MTRERENDDKKTVLEMRIPVYYKLTLRLIII